MPYINIKIIYLHNQRDSEDTKQNPRDLRLNREIWKGLGEGRKDVLV